MKPSFQMSKDLDFNIDSTEKRIDKVEEIVESYDAELVNYYDEYYDANKTTNSFMQDIVSTDLEKLADYILFADNKEQRELAKKNKPNNESSILSKSQEARNLKKEKLTDDVTYFEANLDSGEKYNFHSQDKRYKNKMGFKEDEPKRRKKSNPSLSRNKITKADLEKYPVIKESNELIENFKTQIRTGLDANGNSLSVEQIKKLKWFCIELRKDQVTYKNSMKKEVNAKSVIQQSPNLDVEVNLADFEIIEFLFHDYSLLKQYSYDAVNSDLKHILMDFERLVDSTHFSDIVKEILILKIDGLSHDEIQKELEHKFETNFCKQHLSTLIRSTIPKKIIETYKRQLENWYYLEVVKGNYKTCTQCGEIKLATTNYFSKDKQKKYGVKNICKICNRTK